MRLACPNCGARYDVPDDAVPPQGRDVECSNCGYAWFQDAPAPWSDVSAGHEGERGDGAAGDDAAPDAARPRLPSERDWAAGRGRSVASVPLAAVPGGEDGDARAGGESRAGTLEDSVRAILQEEAAHERAVRAAEARVTDAPGEPAPVDDRMPPVDDGEDGAGFGQLMAETDTSDADLSDDDTAMAAEEETPEEWGEASLDGAPDEAGPPARRALLPDVEEITSTLHPGNRGMDEADAEVEALPDLNRRGARTGFLLLIALVILAADVYLAADDLARWIPALADVLGDYVAFIERMREALRNVIEGVVETLAAAGG